MFKPCSMRTIDPLREVVMAYCVDLVFGRIKPNIESLSTSSMYPSPPSSKENSKDSTQIGLERVEGRRGWEEGRRAMRIPSPVTKSMVSQGSRSFSFFLKTTSLHLLTPPCWHSALSEFSSTTVNRESVDPEVELTFIFLDALASLAFKLSVIK